MVTTAIQQLETEEQLFVFEDVDWSFYQTVLHQLEDRHVFVTFDGKRLEVMSPSWKHERHSDLLARLVVMACEESQLPFLTGGSTTFKKKDLNRGLEPDHCFYIQNVRARVGKRKVNLATDLPPDLAIEVEISHRLLDRIGIYGRLRIPEIWRHDGTSTSVLLLGRSGRYKPAQRSAAIPWLPLDELDRLLQRSWSMDDLEWSKLARMKMRQIFKRAPK
jgi:Uma2 family endonuclease